jgi:hypothetical protein
LNPVFVKEMRQAVRGRLVLCMFLLTLSVMFGLSAWLLLTRDPEQSGFGAQFFAALLNTLTLLTGLCVPAWSGGRMLHERHGEGGVDLLYYTPMSAGEIIQGKLLSNVALTAVFFAAGAPFLAVAPLLRGVDVLTVILLTGLHFLTVVLLAQAGLVLASLPIGRVWKGLIGAGLGAGLGGGPYLLLWLDISSGRMVSEFIWALVEVVMGMLVALNFLVVMAASYIAPVKRPQSWRANWTPPMRPEPPPLPAPESSSPKGRQAVEPPSAT